jgi:hypothetical protein
LNVTEANQQAAAAPAGCAGLFVAYLCQGLRVCRASAVFPQLIVRFKPTADATKKNAAAAKGKGQAKKTLRAGNGASTGDLVLLSITDDTAPGGKPSKAKLKEMANNIKAGKLHCSQLQQHVEQL